MTTPDTSRQAPLEGLATLLDPAFGLGIWAAHFLVVYVGAALTCVTRLDAARGAGRTMFLAVLVLVTVAATAVVIMHALRRYQRFRGASSGEFRMSITLGVDAISVLAILWQLFPIALAPVCR